MEKALQVASVASMIDQFTGNNIDILQEKGYRVDVAANFAFGSTCTQERVEKCREDLNERGIKVYNLLFDRKIINKSNIIVYKQLKKIIDENNYDIIHCHSPIGGVITRLAARKARKKGTKVIYTAHGFHFFRGASLINWLLFFPIEWLLSFWTDVLITINQEDYKLAKKVMHAKVIEYIPGIGVNVQQFSELAVNREKKREEIGVPVNCFLLFSVGELNKNKNHTVIIEAIAKLKNLDVHYCIAGQGNLKESLKEKAIELGIEKKIHFLGFRTDVAELYKVSDVFCFPSYREGLSVSLMEAMSAGLPCICSDIRGNNDLVQVNSGGYLFLPNDVNKVSNLIDLLYDDEKLRLEMGTYNQQFIKNFDKEIINKRMKQIY